MTKVAIIGGGPSGFAVARALMHEPHPFDIHIYDKQDRPGGVWIYTGKGPLYRDLTSNIHKLLMQYKGHEYGDDVPEFVDRRDVLTYVVNYSREVESHDNVTVHWSTTVDTITKKGNPIQPNGSDPADSTGKWDVILDNGQKFEYDFVLVASGHSYTPFIPTIPGLTELSQQPGRVMHTIVYDTPEPFRNKRVLIVGNSSSGHDVAIQLLSQTTNLLIARHSELPTDAAFEGLPTEEVEWKPAPSRINPETREVEFEDGSKAEVDVILLATGYLYRFAFLHQYQKNVAEPIHNLPVLDYPAEKRVANLHKYMFYIGDPTLAFVTLNIHVAPLPLAECQGAVIARVWSQRLQLPSREEMVKEENKLIAEKPGSKYLFLGNPKDMEYMNSLNDWVDSAGAGGFFAERWSPETVEIRNVSPLAKVPTLKEKLRANIAERKRHYG